MMNKALAVKAKFPLQKKVIIDHHTTCVQLPEIFGISTHQAPCIKKRQAFAIMQSIDFLQIRLLALFCFACLLAGNNYSSLAPALFQKPSSFQWFFDWEGGKH